MLLRQEIYIQKKNRNKLLSILQEYPLRFTPNLQNNVITKEINTMTKNQKYASLVSTSTTITLKKNQSCNYEKETTKIHPSTFPINRIQNNIEYYTYNEINDIMINTSKITIDNNENLTQLRRIPVGLILTPQISSDIIISKTLIIPISIWCSFYNTYNDDCEIHVSISEIKPIILYNDQIIDILYDNITMDIIPFTVKNIPLSKNTVFIIQHIGTVYIHNVIMPTLLNSLYTVNFDVSYNYILPDSTFNIKTGIYTNCRNTEQKIYNNIKKNSITDNIYIESSFIHVYDMIKYYTDEPILSKKILYEKLDNIKYDDNLLLFQNRICNIGNIQIPYKNSQLNSILQINIPLSIGFYCNEVNNQSLYEIQLKISEVSFSLQIDDIKIDIDPKIETDFIILHVKNMNMANSTYLCQYIGNVTVNNIQVKNIYNTVYKCILNVKYSYIIEPNNVIFIKTDIYTNIDENNTKISSDNSILYKYEKIYEKGTFI